MRLSLLGHWRVTVHVWRVLVIGYMLDGLHDWGHVYRLIRRYFDIFILPVIFIVMPMIPAVFLTIGRGTGWVDFHLFDNIFGRFLLLLINMRYMLSLSLWGEDWYSALGQLQIIIRNLTLL